MINSGDAEIVLDLFKSFSFRETEKELIEFILPVFLDKLKANRVCLYKDLNGELELFKSVSLNKDKSDYVEINELTKQAQFFNSKDEDISLDGLDVFYKIDGFGVLVLSSPQNIVKSKVKTLRPLMQHFSLSLSQISLYQSQKLVEQKLKRSEEILKAVALATAELLDGSNIQEAITKSLYYFGEATGVDRVYFFQADNENKTLSQICEWNSGSAEPQINNPYLQNQPLELFYDSIEILKNNHVYNFIVREIPEGSPTKGILEMQDIKSVLLVPVIVEELFWGFVGFDDCVNEYVWTENEVAILQSFPTSISKAIIQEMYEKKLQDMALFPIQNPDPVYRINKKGSILLQNKSGERIKSFKYNKQQYDKESYLKLIAKNVFENIQTDLEFEVESNNNDYYLIRSILSPNKEHINVYTSNINKRVEIDKDLKNSEERLKQLILSLDEAVLLEDEHRRVIFTNQMFCDFFSIPVPPESLIGYDCTLAAEETKHLFKNENTFVSEINALILDRRQVVNQEIELKNGKILSRSYIPLILNNEYKGHLWKYSDITPQKNYERNLEARESKYRNIISNMNLGLMEVDLDDKIVFVNKSFEKLSGYIQAELIGKKAAELFLNKENIQIIRDAGEERLKGVSSTYELEARDKDGNTRWWLVSGAPNYNDEGQITGSVGIHLDLTENRLAQEHIRTNEEVFRKITESSTDVVTLQKPDLSFIYISPSIQEVLGYTFDEAKKLGLENVWHEDHMPILQELVTDFLIDNRQSITVEVKLKNKSGSWVWVESAISKIFNSKNQLILVQGTTRNISKRKQFEQEREEARKREKELVDLKKVFVSMASHQFRTPLTVIQSNVEIIESVFEGQEKNVPALFSKSLTRMKSQIRNMTALMNDILILGKLDNNNLKLVLDEVEINEFLQEIINDTFNTTSLKTEERIVDFIPLKRPLLVKLDKQLFSHAFVNLVSNAIKYTTDDYISPKVKVTEIDASNIKIEVIDYGIGIPENDLENIRSPFYRGKNVSKIQGTGLGLSIADQFVSLHGGELKIYSKPNKGTRVEILMPIKND